MKLLAEIVDGVVRNAIVVPNDATPEFALDVLGLPGTWVLAEEGAVGVGFTYDVETGAFAAPIMDLTEPSPEDPPEEPTE
jgi:hypothetical protein